MKHVLFLIIIPTLIVYSCVIKDRDISMVGKWYRFSIENGYSEIEIDSQYVVAFSEKLGKSKLEYKIENDSFKYLTIDYSARITPYGDSVIVLSDKYNTTTLYRYDESVNAFKSAPDESDSLAYDQYLNDFANRAMKAWAEEGISRK
jgi:hypothetical protein